MLTLLTPTGCRPLAWAQCERLMARQDYAEPVRWIIVDDGEPAQPVTFSRPGWQVQILRPRPPWRSGQNTQARNMLAALDAAGTGPIAIIEDDDYYAPTWLSRVSNELAQADLVGQTRMRYYHVGHRCWYQHENRSHASLCATAVKGPAVTALRACCKPTVRYFDLMLWRSYRGVKRLFDSSEVLGTKGLPGRAGICGGHRLESFRGYIHDPEGQQLSAWLGEDSAFYLGLGTAKIPCATRANMR